MENLHLTGIETALSGQDKTDHAYQGKQMEIGTPKHFDTQYDGSKGGVGCTAEQANETQCTANAGIQTQQTADYAAKGCADAEGGYDFTALEACGQGTSR